MADISKCHGTSCDIRHECRRFTDDANPFRQSYIEPIQQGILCQWFMPNKTLFEKRNETK